MIDIIANIFLKFSHDEVVIPLIILGYIWLDRETFFHAACVLFISMILDYCLKITFKIPLSFDSGVENYAFPSGHMQSSFTLYGYLFLNTYKFTIKASIVILLIAIAFGLVHFGYHNYYDILGAVFFSSLLLIFYRFHLQKDKHKILVKAVFWGNFLMLYGHIIHHLNDGVWLPYYALLGFTAAGYYIKNKMILADKIDKTCASLFCAIILFSIIRLYSCVDLPAYLSQTKWFIISFCVVCSLYSVKSIRSKLV